MRNFDISCRVCGSGPIFYVAPCRNWFRTQQFDGFKDEHPVPIHWLFLFVSFAGRGGSWLRFYRMMEKSIFHRLFLLRNRRFFYCAKIPNNFMLSLRYFMIRTYKRWYIKIFENNMSDYLNAESVNWFWNVQKCLRFSSPTAWQNCQKVLVF